MSNPRNNNGRVRPNLHHKAGLFDTSDDDDEGDIDTKRDKSGARKNTNSRYGHNDDDQNSLPNQPQAQPAFLNLDNQSNNINAPGFQDNNTLLGLHSGRNIGQPNNNHHNNDNAGINLDDLNNHNIDMNNNPHNNNNPNNHTQHREVLNENTYNQLFSQLYARYFTKRDEQNNAQQQQSIRQFIYELTSHFYTAKHYSINLNEVPRIGAVILHYDQLDQCEVFGGEFANELKNNPRTTLNVLSLSIHLATIFFLTLFSTTPHPTDHSQPLIIVNDSAFLYPTIKIRIHDYPKLTTPSDIGSNLIDKYVSFLATITRLSTVRPLIIEIPFNCYQCSAVTFSKYDDGIYHTPAPCIECTKRGKVGRSWVPNYHNAKAIDWQQMLVQEVIDPENNSAGRIPVLTETELSRDLIGLQSVGDQVQVSGIVKARRVNTGGFKGGANNGYTIYIDVCSLHVASQPNSFVNFVMHPNGNSNTEEQQQQQHQQIDPNLPDIIDWSSTISSHEQPYHQTATSRTHQLLLDHQQRRRAFVNELIHKFPTFGRIITPLYLPIEYPPIVAGGYTISAREFQGIAYIHQQGFLPKYLVQSICPSIYGHIGAKFGILLSLLGGVDRSVISPQEASINKFNTFLRENNISLDCDDDFFNQYRSSVIQQQQQQQQQQSNDQQPNEQYCESHLISNNQGGVTTAAYASSTSNGSSTSISNTLSSLRTRSNIHILLIGEPGLGKSQLLREVSTLSSRGVYISGKGASTAGLTASLVKEGKGFTLQCGGVVIGDKGITCIDELDKLQSEHKALLECMEQQTVSITKSGTICQLPARTTIVAAANPKGGVYNRSMSVLENLNISPILLSRFDLCFLILDQGNQEYDKVLTDHVIGIHTNVQPLNVYNSSDGGNRYNQMMMGQNNKNDSHLLHVLNTENAPGTHKQRHSLGALASGSGGSSMNTPGQPDDRAFQDKQHRNLDNRYFDFEIPPVPGYLQSDYYYNQYQSASINNTNTAGDDLMNMMMNDLNNPNRNYNNNFNNTNPQPNPITPSYIELLNELGYNPREKLSQRYHMSMVELENFDAVPSLLLKKYIAFAREYCRPTLSPQAREIIKQFYLTLRAKTSLGDDGNNASSMNNTVTTRQLESLIRLCEARAKLELRPIALPIDAYEAIEMMRETIFQVLLDQSGVVDAARATTGQSKSVRGARQSLESALHRIGHEKNDDVFSYREIKQIARGIIGFDLSKFESVFEALRNEADLIMASDRGFNMYRYRPIFN